VAVIGVSITKSCVVSVVNAWFEGHHAAQPEGAPRAHRPSASDEACEGDDADEERPPAARHEARRGEPPGELIQEAIRGAEYPGELLHDAIKLSSVTGPNNIRLRDATHPRRRGEWGGRRVARQARGMR
jgi:hypothetical protein